MPDSAARLRPRPILRDEALQHAFDREGYVEVPMLDAQELARLREALAGLKPADDWAPDGSGPAGNSYHCSFLDTDAAFKRAAFDLLADAFADVVDRYLADFRPLSANFYVKPPGRGRIPVHQNWPVLDDLGATSVTVWCPLSDVDSGNGALHLVPGSHKLVPHVESPRSPAYFAGFQNLLDDCLVPVPVRAGAGVIFDDSIVHGSPDNGSDAPRVAVQITCIPREERPVFYFRTDDERFELIEADRDFWLDNGVADLGSRRPEWTGRGTVANRNRALDKAEFLALLRGESVPAAPPDRAGRLRTLLKSLLGR